MKNLVLSLLVAIATVGWMTSVLTAEETISGRLEHVACMVRCAQNGDPIGILTADGLYKITGNWAASNPDQLATLMAKSVHATGEASETNGELLFKVSKIEPAD